ncbi:unnamed protein product [Wickerhamomyces anomalus]
MKLLNKKKQLTQKEQDADKQLKFKVNQIGNIAHESVVISNDEDNNELVRTWKPEGSADIGKVATATGKEAKLSHHEVLLRLDGYDPERGVPKNEYTPLQAPVMMNKDVMAKTAQLSQFDQELYKVIDGEDEKYLIATLEQPISAYHAGEWFESPAEQLPDFINSLGLPYRVVGIVSGELNNAAAKKYDLEAWFPFQQEYKELVPCSNCTDYQSRNLEIRSGIKKMNVDREKKYVHWLNSTLCATEGALCCILENYQTEDGLVIPEVLRKYIPGEPEFIPFLKELPKNSTSQKKK